MAQNKTLTKYQTYLELVHEYAQRLPWEGIEDVADLLGPGEVLDLLVIRDKLSQQALTSDEQVLLDRLDDLLVKYRQIVTDNVPELPGHPQSYWWWHLDEGPEVREQAKASQAA